MYSKSVGGEWWIEYKLLFGLNYFKMKGETLHTMKDPAMQQLKNWYVGKVTQMVKHDCQLSGQKIAKELNMNRKTLSLIFTKDLDIKSVLKWYWKIFVVRKEICSVLVTTMLEEPNLLRKKYWQLVETWVFQYDPELKSPMEKSR